MWRKCRLFGSGSIYQPALVTLLVAFALAGCRSETAENGTRQAKPAASAAPSAAPDRSRVKTFEGRGKVTKIDLEQVSVELDHEEIKGLMPKMIMEFYVREKAELEALKTGDEVEFILEDDAGAERIISIKKTK